MPGNVIVVESSESWAKYICEVLDGCHFSVVHIQNAQFAGGCLTISPVFIVWGLKSKDNLILPSIRELRNVGATLPMIVVAGDSVYRGYAMRAGCNFEVEPLGLKEFLTTNGLV